jgi:hypothetical protein
MKKCPTFLAKKGNEDQDNIEIPSHHNQNGHHQGSKK